MHAYKKKGTTPQRMLSKAEPSAPLLPEEQEFHQHLRVLAVYSLKRRKRRS